MTPRQAMVRRRQAGLSIIAVIVVFLLVVGVVMAGVVSLGTGRNLFAEGWDKARSAARSGSGQLFKPQRKAGEGDGARPDGAIRRCVIDGKTVISNTDCKSGARGK